MAKDKTSANTKAVQKSNDLHVAIDGLMDSVSEDLLRSFATIRNRQEEIRVNVKKTRSDIERGARASGRPFSL